MSQVNEAKRSMIYDGLTCERISTFHSEQKIRIIQQASFQITDTPMFKMVLQDRIDDVVAVFKPCIFDLVFTNF